jgi:hypothetical protein
MRTKETDLKDILSRPDPGAPPPVKRPPDVPAPVNVNFDTVKAEWALLANVEPELLLKGMLLECRELVRGTANLLCDPELYDMHENQFRFMQGAAQTSVAIADSIARLRQPPAGEERRQRLVIERIDRGFARLPPGYGEGGATHLPKNE